MTFWSILRQRCWSVLVVAGVRDYVYYLSLIPGDPPGGCWRVTAPAMLSWKIFRQQLGLDQPLYVQFYRYVDLLMITGEASVPGVRCWKSSYLLPGDAGAGFWCPAAGTPDWHPLRHALCSLAKSLAGSSGANNGHYWEYATPAFWLGLGVIVLFW